MIYKYSAIINVILRAVIKARETLIRDFGEIEHLQISKKGVGDFVTNADIKTQRIIINELQKARPDYAILAEEGNMHDSKEPYKFRWIIDPIDGTNNFMHGLPYFCISVALEHMKEDGTSEIVAAVVDAPAIGETFLAEKSHGAWIERPNVTSATRKIRVAKKIELSECLISLGKIAGNHDLIPSDNIIRILGSSVLSLCYIAAGRLDIYSSQATETHHEKPWDIAAGLLIVKEAGGVVYDQHGNVADLNSKHVIAGNANLLANFMKITSGKENG